MAKYQNAKDALAKTGSRPPKQHKKKVERFKSKAAKSRRTEELRHKIKMKNLVESKAIAWAIKRPEE
jgi:hypothetical protein